MTVSRLSAAIPYVASRPTTVPRFGTFLSRTDAVLGKAAASVMKVCGWHGMQGEAWSDPTSLVKDRGMRSTMS
jgi:hypothetical protein